MRALRVLYTYDIYDLAYGLPTWGLAISILPRNALVEEEEDTHPYGQFTCPSSSTNNSTEKALYMFTR